MVRITAGELTGVATIRTPTGLSSYYRPTGICVNEKWRQDNNLLEGHGDKYDEAEECLALGWMRGWKRNHRVHKARLNYLSTQDVDISNLPRGWLRMVYNYGQADNMLRYRVYLPPEHYKFEREDKYGYSVSPWVPNNIDEHPKKEKFVEGAIS